MQIKDVIAYCDRAFPTDVPVSVKVDMLAALERDIARRLYATHEGGAGVSASFTRDSELSMGNERPDMYRFYLLSRLALMLGQEGRYAAWQAAYESEYALAAREYNRTHAPLHTAGRLKFR